MQNKFHGWISVIREAGYTDTFRIEVREGDHTVNMVVRSAAEAIEWFDKKVGEPVKLLETPIGAYRVYTEVQPPIAVAGGSDGRNMIDAVKLNVLRMDLQRQIGVVRALKLRGDADTAVLRLIVIAEQLDELSK